MTASESRQFLAEKANWSKAIKPYQQSDTARSIGQIATSVLPYFAMWVLIALLAPISYWLAVPAALLAAGFLTRTFIIFHDCGHGAFFRSRRANDIVGFITGVLVFTPYYSWRHGHALHHSASGDLDRRGNGDIWMMTVAEYEQSNRWQRLVYRGYRNPIVLFLIAPLVLFIIVQRFPSYGRARERRSVWYTNLVLLATIGVMGTLIGWQTYLVFHLLIMSITSVAGVWLFYVQHQYEGVYWQRHESWNYAMAAVEGSSFYKLPRVLQWFTGNIGYHHIHHLSPRIPNYNLEACHNAIEGLQVEPVTLRDSIRCLRFRLWDEANYRLISFGDLRRLRTAEGR